jgi:ATP-dependent RNA helicase RhlE
MRGRYKINIKVDVKIVSDHPYPWHSGSGNSIRRIYKTKNSNRSGGAHKSESDASKQNKNAGTNRFFLN